MKCGMSGMVKSMHEESRFNRVARVATSKADESTTSNTLGVVKVVSERIKSYIAFAQFVMVGYLFIKESTFSPLLFALLCTVSLTVIGIFDFKYILPAEYKTYYAQNPFTVKMLETEKEILKILKERHT